MTDSQNSGSEDKNRYYYKLIEVVKLLASNYETQVKAFPSDVHIPDEFATTFNDVFVLADQIEKAGLISHDLWQKLKDIDDLFDRLSDGKHADFWTLESLKVEPVWEKIRQMAQNILKELGVDLSPPNLNWITYIPSK